MHYYDTNPKRARLQATTLDARLRPASTTFETTQPTHKMKEIYKAIAEIQRGAVVVKRNRNSTLNSTYADLADVRAFLDPLLAQHGLSISFAPGALRECPPGKLVQGLTLEVVSVESGAVLAFTGEYPVPEGNRAVTSAQAYGSSLTYAMRYALCARFGLITGDDDDAQRAQHGMASGGRDAAPEISDTGHWKLLTEGYWTDAAGPDGRTIGDMAVRERADALRKHPNHSALIAWAADRLSATMDDLGLTWATFCERAGGTWPEHMELCTGEQIMSAAQAAKGMRV